MSKSLILGDCLEKMSEIEDNSVDFILVDPPFGTTAPKWDTIIDFKKLWQNFDRIIKKEGVIAIFAAQPFTTKVINSRESKFKYCWYWMKNQGTNFFHAARMPIRKVEEICIFGGKTYYPQIKENCPPTNPAKGISKGRAYFGTNSRDEAGGKTTRLPTNILDFKCVDNYSRIHSAQKPLDLCEYLIKTYTKEGDLILDCCCGSGTTLLGAQNLNRHFIGIEQDEKYFNVAKSRLKI